MRLLFVLFFITLLFDARSQANADSLYIVTYTIGSAWDPAKKPFEQSYFKSHSENLSALRNAGTIKAGARYADKGIIIVMAPTFESAKELINKDPAVANNLFNADVQRLSIFYEGCLEKPK